MFNAGQAIGDFREVVASERLLVFETKWAMVCTYHCEFVHAQTLPQITLVMMVVVT